MTCAENLHVLAGASTGTATITVADNGESTHARTHVHCVEQVRTQS
jgi:hypothetical protein